VNGIRVVGQQGSTAIKKIDREKIIAARNENTPVIGHHAIIDKDAPRR